MHTCQTLIGLGASSISRFPAGYVQNAPATAAYIQRIEAAGFAGSRGYALTDEDRLRARAIELLMCDFMIDLDALQAECGPRAKTLLDTLTRIAAKYDGVVRLHKHQLEIAQEGRPLTRMIAAEFDQHVPDHMTYSRAS